VYEIFPIAAGVVLGIAVAGRGRIRALAIAGLGLAVVAGVTVSFASGEWRDGVIYPIWDSVQASCAYALSLALGWRLAGHRERPDEG
jgi:hypothetical protein